MNVRLAEFFKILSEENRLRMIKMMLIRPCCICEFVGILELSYSTVSEHIRKMKKIGLVEIEKNSYWSSCFLNTLFLEDALYKHIFDVIGMYESEIYRTDAEKIIHRNYFCVTDKKEGESI